MSAREPAPRPGRSGIAGVLLRIAVRRWPAGLREEQAREWTAEIDALRGEPGAARRRLAFAASLAVTPASGDPLGPRGWRELLPGLGLRFKPAAGFAAAALGIAVLAAVLNVWSAALAVPLGIVAGLRSRLPRLGTAVAVTTAVGSALTVGTFYAFGALATGEGPVEAEVNRRMGAASIAFAVLLAVLLTAVVRLATGRWWWAAVPLAVVGLPVAVRLSWAIGVVARPESLWSEVLGRRPGFDRFEPTFLVLGGTLLAYALGVGRRRGGVGIRAHRGTATGADASTPDLAPWRPGRAAAVTGAVAALAGLSIWIYAITGLDAAADRVPQDSFRPMLSIDLTMWSHELRWAGVLLAGLGFFLAAAGRSGAVLGAIVLAGVPLAGGVPLTRLSHVDDGTRVAAAMAVAALALAAAAWVTGRRVALAPTRVAAVRRGLAGVAAAAALSGPLVLTHPIHNGGLWPTLPVGLLAVIALVPALFVTVAGFAAGLARADAPSAVRTALLTAGAAAVVAVPAVLTVAGAGPTMDDAVVRSVEVTLTGLLAIVVGAVALGPALGRRGRGAVALARRLVLGVVTAAGLWFVFPWACSVLSFVPATVLLWLDGTGYPVHGMWTAYLPGAAMLALGGMALFSVRLLPDRVPADVAAAPAVG